MRSEREWTFGSWPPTDELVWCLFDVNVEHRRNPQVLKGEMRYVNKELVFFENREKYRLNPHFKLIAWRFCW